MRHRSSIRSVLSFAAIFWLVFGCCAFAEDTLSISGECLSDQEMSETRGGFTLPGGDFLYFSMDFLELGYFSNGELGSESASAWVNAQRQRAVINENGEICAELTIVKIGEGDGAAWALSGSNVLNITSVNNSFNDFCGIGTNLQIAGINNTLALQQIFDVSVQFINSNNLEGNHIQEFLFH